ncbi:MAG: DUF6062 family protein [Armatimonadota bacterium]
MSTSRASRHLVFHELLDALRGGHLCALCHLETRSVERYFSSVFHESVNDPGLREELFKSRGFCPRHARIMLRNGDALGIAILYEDQVRFALLDHEGGAAGKHRPGGAICPACRRQTDARSRYCSTLLEWLNDADVQEALQRSGGFCVPHTRYLQERATAVDRDCLTDLLRRRLESLKTELGEFRRKNDYRFRHEGFGSEADSWRRAVRLLTGEDDVF